MTDAVAAAEAGGRPAELYLSNNTLLRLIFIQKCTKNTKQNTDDDDEEKDSHSRKREQ